MNPKKWFKSKPYWFKGILMGVIYPLAIISVIILINLLNFIKLGFIFEIILGFLMYPIILFNKLINYAILWVFYPSYMLTESFIYIKCSNLICNSPNGCFSAFRFCFLFIDIVLAFILGCGTGLLVSIIRQKFIRK